MALLLFSSAKGPDECMLAVAKAFRRFVQEAEQLYVDVNLLEQEPGERVNTFRSLLLSVEGDNSTILIQRWLGTIKWVCQSPYRSQHKRKNWFIGIARLAPVTIIDDDQVRYEATKASGAGGQHINKTLSAIRAVHVTTGISVKVQSERSQHANKRLARLLLAHKLAQLNQNYQQQHKILLHQLHQQVQRGEAKLIFYDEVFKAK